MNRPRGFNAFSTSNEIDVDKIVDAIEMQESEDDLDAWLGQALCPECDSQSYERLIKHKNGKIKGCTDCIETN